MMCLNITVLISDVYNMIDRLVTGQNYILLSQTVNILLDFVSHLASLLFTY